MKIVIYSRDFLPAPGGVQTIVFELARGLREWQSDGSATHPLDVTVVTRTRERSDEERAWPFGLVRCPSVLRLWKLLRSADVIHLAGPALLPMAMGLVLQKPVVIEHHGFQAACPNGLLFFQPTQTECPGHFMARRYGKCFECNRAEVGVVRSVFWLVSTPVRRWLSNRVATNIMPTDWLATTLRLNRMVTVHHGVVEHDPGNSTLASNSTFAFQGRLVSTKGVGILLAAAKHLRDEGLNFHLKIIGVGPELKTLRSQAASLDGKVEFLGHVPEGQLEGALADVSSIIVPSLGGEVFGLVAAENMSRGRLVIVSSIGALEEVVGATGLAFPVGNAKELASCMRKVLENSETAHSLGAAARERAARLFNRETMIQAHVSLYREATTR
jgi:glycosyltransferase involved in cell wall biosynthesis